MKPSTRFALVVLALAVFIGSVYLLVTASPLLLVTAWEPIGLPLGNLTTWAGIAALPTAVYLGFLPILAGEKRMARVLKKILWVLVALSVAWGFVCFALAGNWQFNFDGGAAGFRGSETAGRLFRAYTFAVPAMTLLLVPVLLFLGWSRRRRGSDFDPS